MVQPPGPRRLPRRRIPLVAIALAFVLAFAANAAAAVPTPVGSCYDLLSFDGLDARNTASHCASALTTAGYAATGYHNTDAQSAAARNPTDAVFFSAGHALVDQDSAGNTTAAALLFEFPAPGQQADALLGDAATAGDIEGAQGICDDTGNCHLYDTPVVAYPWGDNAARLPANLVVLQSCRTAREGSAFTDMTTLLSARGAGTVIGFRDDVAFPVNAPESNLYGQAWANRFWADLAAGATYAAATVDATNAVGGAYGYGSYVLRQAAGAPTSLYPPQYAVLPAAPATSDVSQDAVFGRAVGRFTGRDEVRVAGLRPVSTPDGSQLQGEVAGLGPVRVDPDSGHVTSAVWEDRLTEGVAGDATTLAQARAAAERFAAERGLDLGGLALRVAETRDHGALREARFVWQQRSGGAWLPGTVSIGVDRASGAVTDFDTVARAAAPASVAPIVTASEARARAVSAVAPGPAGAVAGEPRLMVVREDGARHLVWETEVRGRPTGTAFLPVYRVVHTDAATGVTTVRASS